MISDKRISQIVNESIKRVLKEIGSSDETYNNYGAVDYFKDMLSDEENYPDAESIIDGLRSLLSNGEITEDDYNYVMQHWDEIAEPYY